MEIKNKIIYEFYYIVGLTDFSSCYKLVVDKETKKMLYGNALYEGITQSGRFSVNKSNLNQVYEKIDRRKGLVYRIQVDDSNYESAYKKAKDIVYKHLVKIAEKFRMHEEEN